MCNYISRMYTIFTRTNIAKLYKVLCSQGSNHNKFVVYYNIFVQISATIRQTLWFGESGPQSLHELCDFLDSLSLRFPSTPMLINNLPLEHMGVPMLVPLTLQHPYRPPMQSSLSLISISSSYCVFRQIILLFRFSYPLCVCPSDLSCPSYVLPPISLSDHLSILFSVPLAQGIKHSLKGSIDVVKCGSTIRPTSILPFLSSQGQSFVFIVN